MVTINAFEWKNNLDCFNMSQITYPFTETDVLFNTVQQLRREPTG